jgi:hypothetical protein
LYAKWQSIGGVTTALLNGVAVSGLSGAVGSKKLYTILVPAGATSLTIATSGGSGDCDVYARRGAAPTELLWDWDGTTAGNNETISIMSPEAGIYYIILSAHEAYSGVTLTATASYTASGSGNAPATLASGFAVTLADGQLTNTLTVAAGGTLTMTERYGTVAVATATCRYEYVSTGNIGTLVLRGDNDYPGDILLLNFAAGGNSGTWFGFYHWSGDHYEYEAMADTFTYAPSGGSNNTGGNGGSGGSGGGGGGGGAPSAWLLAALAGLLALRARRKF